MNFFKSCCSTKDAGEPAKKSDMEKKPEDDAAAAEAKPAEEAVEAAPEAAPAEEAPAEEAPADDAGSAAGWEKLTVNEWKW